MTLIDCLSDPRVIAGDMWFRPVDDVYAYAVVSQRSDSEIKRVPSLRGGELYLTTSVSQLTGAWEIVSPDVVNDWLEALRCGVDNAGDNLRAVRTSG